MKESTSLGLLAGSIGFAFVLACGPSKPAVTGDDGTAGATPSATASTDPGTGGSSAGGSSDGGAPAGGGGDGGGTAPTATGGGTSAPQTPAQMVAAGDASAGEKLFDQE